jgi:hypothetical protein
LFTSAAENTNAKVCDVGMCAGINSCGLGLFGHTDILPEHSEGANRILNSVVRGHKIGQMNRHAGASDDDLRLACYHACDTKRHTDMDMRDFSDILCQSFI